MSCKEQEFSIEKQGLKFYRIYTSTIVENRSAFIKKLKNKSSWKVFGYSEEDLNKLTKPI